MIWFDPRWIVLRHRVEDERARRSGSVGEHTDTAPNPRRERVDIPQLVGRVGIKKDADERLDHPDDGPELRIVGLALSLQAEAAGLSARPIEGRPARSKARGYRRRKDGLAGRGQGVKRPHDDEEVASASDSTASLSRS